MNHEGHDEHEARVSGQLRQLDDARPEVILTQRQDQLCVSLLVRRRRREESHEPRAVRPRVWDFTFFEELPE